MKCLLIGLIWLSISSDLFAEDAVKLAIEKALPWLEEESDWWIEEKECVSCHHTTFSIWARDLALGDGFGIDEEKLDRDRKWVFNQFVSERTPNPDRPDDVIKPGELVGDRNVEGIAQFLISPSSAGFSVDQINDLKQIIARNQTPENDWAPAGQLPLQKRPKNETRWVSRLWISHAAGIDDTAEFEVKAKSNEWYAMNAISQNDPVSLQNLLDRQNPDGGWSWIDGEPSSPTGTGQALFAIGRLEKQREFPEAVSRARNWLVEKQTENGSWKTFSTKRRERSGRISNFWGTSWAVIGLLESK